VKLDIASWCIAAMNCLVRQLASLAFGSSILDCRGHKYGGWAVGEDSS